MNYVFKEGDAVMISQRLGWGSEIYWEKFTITRVTKTRVVTNTGEAFQQGTGYQYKRAPNGTLSKKIVPFNFDTYTKGREAEHLYDLHIKLFSLSVGLCETLDANQCANIIAVMEKCGLVYKENEGRWLNTKPKD